MVFVNLEKVILQPQIVVNRMARHVQVGGHQVLVNLITLAIQNAMLAALMLTIARLLQDVTGPRIKQEQRVVQAVVVHMVLGQMELVHSLIAIVVLAVLMLTIARVLQDATGPRIKQEQRVV